MEYTYKFSIIIAVYNVEKYIRETIESIINQSMEFEKNVEIVLINDGSSDNSELICKEYANKYPNNIKYIYKNNGGVSSARNLGIKYAKGKYFNFLDSDDLLHPNTLDAVYNFFEKNKFEVDIVTLPIEAFERQEGLYPRYIKFGNASKIINLEENPQDYIFSCAASFYKRYLFKEYKFNTNLQTAEDLYLNTKLFLKNPKFGIISPKQAVYYYRKRFAENSITNTHEYGETWLINVLDYLNKGIIRNLKKTKKAMPQFIKNILIYNVAIRISMPYFISKNNLTKFFKIAEDMLSYVDDSLILAYPTRDYFNTAMLLMIKNKEYDIKKCVYIDSRNNVCINNNILANIEDYHYKISSVRIKEEKIYIHGFINDIIGANFKMFYKNGNDKYDIKVAKTSNSFLQKRFFDIIVGQAYTIETIIPVDKIGKTDIYISINNTEIPLSFENAYNEDAFYYNNKVELNNKYYNINIDELSINIVEDNNE